jgi:hypothetical protein
MSEKLKDKVLQVRVPEEDLLLWKEIAIREGFIMTNSKQKNRPNVPNLIRQMFNNFRNIDNKIELVTPKHLKELLPHLTNISRLGTNINTLAHEVNYLRLKDITHGDGEGLIHAKPQNFEKAINEIHEVRQEVANLHSILRQYMAKERV